jgi:KaiC/GvpD/RAD55 family RecA-like ATPase
MPAMTERRLKTYMTQVFFKCPQSDDPIPLKRRKIGTDDMIDVFLFDDLLGGGIVVPEDIVEARLGQPTIDSLEDLPKYSGTPGLLILVTGAPGSGKTTFALELCYRLSFGDNSQFDKRLSNGLSSIYVSAEASARSVIQNVVSYGWKSDKFYELPPKPAEIRDSQHRVFLFGRNATEGKGETAKTVLGVISGDWLGQYNLRVPTTKPKTRRPSLAFVRPQILVIDSFNTLDKEESPRALSDVLRQCATRFLVTIAIMDTGPGISPEHRWVPTEYMADMEIDFSYDRPENYMIRRLWIVKARFQDHADGWHRMKINPRPTPEAVPSPLNPVIREGGIFVFPSVHRHLSLARGEIDKAKAGSQVPVRHPAAIATPFKALTAAIQGNGFPPGACTCIVGERGGMKSHLAYYTMLKFLEEFTRERAIILSLRDTENAATETLADILCQQVNDEGKRLVPSVDTKEKALAHVRDKLIANDRLEVLYFWPGYISPEEFFHLVCTSVDRLGKGKDNIDRPAASLLIINGLEQLSARFPLCAKESMFISGLLSVLTVKGITVLVTSGGSAGLPSEQGGVPAGLLPMSDLIVQTSFRLLPAENIWSSGVWFPTSLKYSNPVVDMVAQRERTAKGHEPHVIYEIIREPGARECRRRVLFYMGREGDPEGTQLSNGTRTGFVRGSVYVRPLPDEFTHGERP